MTVAAILVAGGDGIRLGADLPKALCIVAGRTLLEHAHERFAAHPDVRDVIVVAPASHLDAAGELVPGTRVVAGGSSRVESVAHGLQALADDIDVVLVHDVARPFVPARVISRVIVALASGAAAVIPVLPMTDTIKRVDGEVVVGTVDRSALRAVQTPQGFRRDVLEAAHAGGHKNSTDDAAMVEANGVTVKVVEGADELFKITRPWDLAIAEMVASR